ncbi:hypothetical protein INT45_010355 [Circinella minor]|uniref:Uncharacterized protein n=1 Tax=Circinella minor TaxID=1195481 RepID=A0A8H7SBL7_9FUNG|nr:hypothetical protein INT45_010355 [Circinella minor]
MVATTHHRRQSSSGASASGRSTRRRPSLRRPSETNNTNNNSRLPSSINARNNLIRAQQQNLAGGPRRASAGLLQQPSHNNHDFLRRPSAPANVETARLSIADRFMASDYNKQRTPSPPPLPPPPPSTTITRPSITLDDYDVPRSSSVSRPSTTELPDSARLTIAESFIRNSNTRSLLSTYSGDINNNNSNSTRTSTALESAHPLEAPSMTLTPQQQQQRSTLDTHITLDLDFAVPPPSSTLDVGRRFSRPFGSQETLVQKPSAIKKQYQFEKDEESITDYETCSLRSSSSSTLDRNRQHSNNNHSIYNDEKQHQNEKGHNMSSEEASNNNNNRKFKHYGDDEQGEEAKGMWIGCCFLSCNGQQHNPKERKQRTEPRKCGRRGWVFGSFIFMILLIITGYLLWPRTPLMRIEGASLLSPAHITETHQGVMVGNVAFESQWLVNITVDNRENRVPTRFTQIDVLAKDALTGLVIGKNNSTDHKVSSEHTLPANTISTIQLPITLDYQARDDRDTTFATLKKACTQQPPKTHHDSKTNQTITEQPERESLQLHFWITLHVFGLDLVGYKPTLIATPATGGFACPLS